MWSRWQQGKVYPSNFDFKRSLTYNFRKSHKVSRKNHLSFWSCTPKTTRVGGGGGAPPVLIGLRCVVDVTVIILHQSTVNFILKVEHDFSHLQSD